MKVLQANLPAYITATLLSVKRGCYDANKNGDVVLRLPDLVNFVNVEVVCATEYNTINRLSTLVDAAYTEVTTRSPATTQADNSGQTGDDSTTTATTWTDFPAPT